MLLKNFYLENCNGISARHTGTTYGYDIPRNITFENITLKNPRTTVKVGGYKIKVKGLNILNCEMNSPAISIEPNAKDITIEKVKIRGLKKEFIKNFGSNQCDITIKDCIVITYDSPCWINVIYLRDGIQNVTIENVTISNVRSYSAIGLLNVSNIVIRNCTISFNSTSSAKYGIWINSSINVTIEDAKMFGEPLYDTIAVKDSADIIIK